MPDALDTKIKKTAELGNTSFGHNGEVYTDLRPHSTSGGITGYRFDHGEKSDPYLKVYFISADGSYLTVWERGYGTETLSFNTSFDNDPRQTLDDRLTMLDSRLDENVFHARLAAAVDTYEETGVPQQFEWRGNTYTNLHDPGKSHVDYRFQHGQGDELKVFFFAEDGTYVSGWSRAGQTTHAHPDRTETDNLYDRLVEVDELLPSSFTVPLTLEEQLAILEGEPDRAYEFQLAGRDIQALKAVVPGYQYLLIMDYDFVNAVHGIYYAPSYYDPVVSSFVYLSDDGLSFHIFGNTEGLVSLYHDWGWQPTNDSGLGELLYGDDSKDTLYSRVQLIEFDLKETEHLFQSQDLSLTDVSRFRATINQAPGGDEIRIDVEGELTGLFGYDTRTTLDGTINHGHDGSEIQNISFTSEAYDLLGYGEESTIEGAINQGNYSLSIETYDALGYDETIVVALVITERREGYGVNLEIEVDSSAVSADCSANADVSEDLRVTSLDVNCSDDDLESDIEDIFEDALVETFAIVEDESLQGSVNLIDEYDIVDETAPVYSGAFAPVDNDDWFI